MLSDCCTVCLTVCDVGVLWPNGWMIKMKVGIEVDLGIGHTALDGHPALPPRKGAQQPPLFSPCLCSQTVANLSSCSYFCTMHLTAKKFHHLTLSRSEVIVLANIVLTNKRQTN